MTDYLRSDQNRLWLEIEGTTEASNLLTFVIRRSDPAIIYLDGVPVSDDAVEALMAMRMMKLHNTLPAGRC
jgi:hypothetical protein